MRKQVIYVTVRLEVECEDRTLEADDIVSDMDYSFESQSAGATIVDTEITEFEVA